jgi:hypothetical protein
VTDLPSLRIEIVGDLWYWRGPAPFHFVTVPDEPSGDLRALSPLVSYGWGVIPVTVRIGDTEWETSVFPKDGRYAVPIKDAVRHAEGLAIGDLVTLELAIGSGPSTARY